MNKWQHLLQMKVYPVYSLARFILRPVSLNCLSVSKSLAPEGSSVPCFESRSHKCFWRNGKRATDQNTTEMDTLILQLIATDIRAVLTEEKWRTLPKARKRSMPT